VQIWSQKINGRERVKLAGTKTIELTAVVMLITNVCRVAVSPLDPGITDDKDGTMNIESCIGNV